MTMPPTMTRSLARVESAKQDVPGVRDLAGRADRPGSASAAETIEDQRERAQQEFKRIWILSTWAH